MAKPDEGGSRPSSPSAIDQLTTSLTAPNKKPAKKAATKRPAAPASRSRAAAGAAADMTLDSFLGGLRQHESGGDYGAKSSSSTASGAYQYLDSTWNHYGGYAHAWQAPQVVQDQRARADVSANFKKYGGDWRKVAAAHFAGSGWVDKHPDPASWDRNPAPGSNNPTVAQYVASVFKNAGMSTDTGGRKLPAGASGGGGGGVGAASTLGAVEAPSTAAAPTGLTLPPNATDKQLNAFIGQKYGYLAGFLHDPQIRKVLFDAAKGGWGQDELLGALEKTSYWKKTSAQARTWDAQTQLDKATQSQNVKNQISVYADQAKKLGIMIDPLALHDLTVTAMRLGWTPEQVTESLRAHGKQSTSSSSAREFDQQGKQDKASQDQAVNNTAASLVETARKRGLVLDPATAKALATQSIRENWTAEQVDTALRGKTTLDPAHAKTAAGGLKQQAEGDYLVKLSDPVLAQWATDISSGKVTADDYTNYLKEQAKSLFPSLSGAIDRGITVNRYVDPYRQQAAALLEINPDSIDFVNDPKFSKALFNTDPKTGDRSQMSLADWQKYLRSTPDYNKTSGAVDQGAQFATMLTKKFGKVAA